MEFVEHSKELSKFWLSLIWFHCELHWWFCTLILNVGQHLHANWFTSILNVNFEFMEIFRQGLRGVDTLHNISSKKRKPVELDPGTQGTTLLVCLCHSIYLVIFSEIVSHYNEDGWGGLPSSWKKNVLLCIAYIFKINF